MVASDELTTIVVDVVTATPDLALVDALARLHVAGRRCGCSIRLRITNPELRALIELVGLADPLLIEMEREAEGRVELGVEEVVQPGDPAV